MKNKLSCVLLGVVGCLCIAGCGHNTVTQSKGYGIDVSWNQDSLIPNLRLGYWDISTALVKENVEVEMTSTAGINATGGNQSNSTNNVANTVTKPNLSTSAGGNVGNTIKLKTGPQTNGYVKDVLISPNVTDNAVKIANSIYSVNNNMNSKGSVSTASSTDVTATTNAEVKIDKSDINNTDVTNINQSKPNNISSNSSVITDKK